MKAVLPTLEHVEHIASHLRQEDCAEAQLVHGVSGRAALLESWGGSPICRCLLANDDEPVGLCGLNGRVVWFIGTDKVYSSRRQRYQFARMSKAWVDSLFEVGAKRLENWVVIIPGVDNKERFRWFEYLGFTIGPLEPWLEGLHARHYWREA